MLGRKRLKARIAELEQELEVAHRDLAVAVVPLGPLRQRITVTKGLWYTARFQFLHNGGPELELADLFVRSAAGSDAYFTGETTKENHG